VRAEKQFQKIAKCYVKIAIEESQGNKILKKFLKIGIINYENSKNTIHKKLQVLFGFFLG
jgi:hypothetical protein